MIRRTISAGFRFRVLLLVAALAVMFAGFAGLGSAARDVYPEFKPPTVEIQTEALGLSAAEVEQLITAPLEADLLNGVAWVDDIRSESVLGLSSITMVFEPGTDLYRARQAVQERLAQAHALPNVSKPPQMLQPTSSTGRAMMIGLTSDKLSLIELSQLARWTVKPRLQGVEGVSNVATFGNRDRQLQVQVDPARLAAAGVTLAQVIATTGNAGWVSPLTFLEASSPGAPGFIETPNQRLGIRNVPPIKSPVDLGKVAIEGKPGRTLADVASIVEDHQPLIGDAQVRGGPGILLVVQKLRGANTLEVTSGVEAALAALAPALTDVTVDTTLYRPADYIERGTDHVAKAGLAGAGLLLLLLLLAFYRWRTALIAALAIGTSVLGAAGVLLATGSTLNMMVLAGLAVGLAVIVDDAISGADRVSRALRDSSAEAPARGAGEVILDALTELRGSLAFGTVLVLLPVLPAFFMDGQFGYFGRPLALAYGAAALVSMLVALLVTPALAVLLFRRTSDAKGPSGAAIGLGRRYEHTLSRTLATPRRPLAVAVVLAVAAAVVLPGLGRSELPALKERDFLVELEATPGTSLQEMNRITGDTSRRLQELAGVRSVSSHAGRAITGDQITNVNNAEMWVRLADEADYAATVSSIKGIAADLGLDSDVLTYQQYALKEVEDDRDGPVVVRVYGHNEDVLHDKARELGARLAQVGGVTNLQVELPVSQDILEVEVDLERAAAAGVKPGDVRRTAATLLAGIEVGALFYDQKVFEVVVWGTPEVRNDPADVANLLIETPSKGLVPLSQVADVRTVRSPDVIERDGAFRRIDITAEVAGRDRSAVAEEIREVIAGTPFPLEFRAELLGGFVERQADDRRLLALAGFAALAMLLLLQACLGSWTLGALFFLSLPLALSGGLLAAWVLGDDDSLGATVGLLALLGLAARQGIVLIRRCQYLQRRLNVPFDPDLVVRAAGERFGPTLLSVLAVGALFVPAAFLGGGAGGEILQPMAVVVLGGLVSVLLVSTVVVPAMYSVFGGRISETELDIILFEEELAGAAPAGSVAPGPKPAPAEPTPAAS